nr:TIGR00645 family protein [Streptomyces albireticuli]
MAFPRAAERGARRDAMAGLGRFKPYTPGPGGETVPSLGYALFATRWLQAPLYFGLVAAQAVYVYEFFGELWSLVHGVLTGHSDENTVMLTVLKLVDVVMIANLLIMVIVGGYETFVSRIGLQGHKDQPEWLSHVNSNVLKVKLAMAIVGISSIHLLQMFVNIHHTPQRELIWGTVIHMAFILSACILAYMAGPMEAKSLPVEHSGPPVPPRRTPSPERSGEPPGPVAPR